MMQELKVTAMIVNGPQQRKNQMVELKDISFNIVLTYRLLVDQDIRLLYNILFDRGMSPEEVTKFVVQQTGYSLTEPSEEEWWVSEITVIDFPSEDFTVASCPIWNIQGKTKYSLYFALKTPNQNIPWTDGYIISIVDEHGNCLAGQKYQEMKFKKLDFAKRNQVLRKQEKTSN